MVAGPDCRYSERQRFNPSLFVLIGILILISINLPRAFEPDSLSASWSLLAATPIVFLRYCYLDTVVDSSGVHIRFRPFHMSVQHFTFHQIVNAEPASYRPIREYGGWGIKWVRNGKAYTVRGDKGVMLNLSNGKNLLIGSARPSELATAIQTGMQSVTKE